MNIKNVEKIDYATLIEIWEASVRATHDFLQEEDIVTLEPLILENYFDAVDLKCAKDESDKNLGFCGVHEGNIEMLFISPEARGNGVGRLQTLIEIKVDSDSFCSQSQGPTSTRRMCWGNAMGCLQK